MIRRDFLALAGSAAALAPAALRAQAAAKGPRPAEDFAALDFMEDPRLSPDGSRFAARLAIDGQQYFAVASLAERRPPAVVTGGGRDINWWRWVNNDWLIVGIGAPDTYEGVDFYLRRVIGVSADGKTIVPLAFREAAEGADDVVWIAGDGSPRVRLALQKSLYYDSPSFWPQVVEIDVSTGKYKTVVRPYAGVTNWYADGSGAVRIGIGYEGDGRKARMIYRESDGGNFKVVERADFRKGEELLVPMLLLAEPGQAVAIDDPDGFDALYRLNLETLTLGERIFADPGYDIEGVITDAAQSRLLGVYTVAEAPKIHWFDPALAKIQEAVEKVTPGRRATILSMDDKRQRFLIHLGGADRPGLFYFFDQDDGRLRLLANVNERIRGAKLNPVRTIRYKARDGLEMAAVLTLPAGREAKGLPVAMMPHGGPFARDAEQWDWWAQFLAERGYVVVQPNFRGSSGYGSAFARKGEGQWGLAMQDDVDDALAHLAAEGIVDAKRACIVGASYGGYTALRAAQRDGARYRCAVSFAGVSDLPALLRYDSRFLNSGGGNDWLRKQAPKLKEVSPINFAGQFSIPVLMVHGKADRRVPVKQSREMAERLKKAGKAYRYVEQPEGDHHFSREADRLSFLLELEAFLKEHNPA